MEDYDTDYSSYDYDEEEFDDDFDDLEDRRPDDDRDLTDFDLDLANFDADLPDPDHLTNEDIEIAGTLDGEFDAEHNIPSYNGYGASIDLDTITEEQKALYDTAYHSGYASAQQQATSDKK